MTLSIPEATQKWLKVNWSLTGTGQDFRKGDFNIQISDYTSKFNKNTMVIVEHGKGTGRLRELFSGEVNYNLMDAIGKRYGVDEPIAIGFVTPSATSSDLAQNLSDKLATAIMNEVVRIAMADSGGASADGIRRYVIDARGFRDWTGDSPPTICRYVRLIAEQYITV